MTQAQDIAKDITQRRLAITGGRFRIKHALAEVLFLQKYGILPHIDNLNSQMFLILEDGEARRVQVYPAGGDDLSINESDLDESADVVVFVEIRDKKIEGGYATRGEIQEAPLSGGEYHLGAAALNSFPEQFTFKSPCPDIPCTSPSVYDYGRDRWLCFACDRARHDAKARDKWGDIDGFQMDYPVSLGCSQET